MTTWKMILQYLNEGQEGCMVKTKVQSMDLHIVFIFGLDQGVLCARRKRHCTR